MIATGTWCQWSPAAVLLQGMTPLHFAAFGQRTDKAELLLSHGADVNARDLDVGAI